MVFIFKICVKRFHQYKDITKGDLPPDDDLIETGISTLFTTIIDNKNAKHTEYCEQGHLQNRFMP